MEFLVFSSDLKKERIVNAFKNFKIFICPEKQILHKIILYNPNSEGFKFFYYSYIQSIQL